MYVYIYILLLVGFHFNIEHADFCTKGMATCLRCGLSIQRSKMRTHKEMECESNHGIRYWPSKKNKKYLKK